ncbi:MAG TPA: hypothetical protein VGL99_00320 [Chloroflexota bacterium]|jgi:hypothetical protein
MAVTALRRIHAGAPRLATASLSPGVLLFALVAPALDLLALVQPRAALGDAALVTAGLAAIVLLVSWARYPRASWLAAATLAALASVAMRAVGADVGSALSLLSVLALGAGGAFASRGDEREALFELSPESRADSSAEAPRPSSERQLPPRAA